MAAKAPDKNQRQKQASIRLVVMAAILVCINILASYFHTGLDLTGDSRFTLSKSTTTVLKNMKEVAVIEVYLKGQFPAGLQRLQEAVRERLRSFKEIAGNKIIFKFTDPLEGKTDEEKKLIVHNLDQKGIRFLNLENSEEGKYSNQPFFPYALVQYNGKEIPVVLVEDPPGKSGAEKISYAEAVLEYKFASAINVLSHATRPRIAYITGNDEELGIKSYYMLAGLPRFYDLDTVDLAHSNYISLAYDAIIINQPIKPFSVAEMLRIDQYVMRGGKVLWAINTLNASLDSLKSSAQFIAMKNDLNLDELTFKYGFRVNNDLIEDKLCMQLGRTNNGEQTGRRDWIYFPRLYPTSDHIIVRNMDFILGGFTNSIDTIKSSGIKKTVLLSSSKLSRTSMAPLRVSLSVMNYPMLDEQFNKPYRTCAILLEGKFHSVYQNKLAPESLKFMDSLHMSFKSECDSSTKMIVTSVGDIFNNDYTTRDGVLPLGYYKWTGEFFSNRNFLLNCLEYLTDNSGVLESRSKQVKLRLLDASRAKKEKTTWQVVNVGIPIAMVLVFASCYLFFRKRKYENK